MARRSSTALLPLLAAAALAPLAPAAQAGASPHDSERGLRIERGGGRLPLFIPHDEALEFDVLLRVALLGETKVGEFELSSGVEQHVERLPVPGAPPASAGRVGWIRGHATGDHLSYELDHVIEMRALPQEWPRVVYRDTQDGTESRRRELRIGTREGRHVSSYRRDAHCRECERREHFVSGAWPFAKERHCAKCKRGSHRVWRAPAEREVPEGTVDMLSAVQLAREMVRLGLDELDFKMLDQDELWNVHLERGERRVVRTPAGRFACREVALVTSVPSGEPEVEFEGLFGIHGTIHIWLEESSGVPVSIGGAVPLGPFKLDVRLALAGYRGTPAEFAPVKGSQTR